MTSKVEDDTEPAVSFISQLEFETKFKWFEYKVDNRWVPFDSKINGILLNAYARSETFVDLSDGEKVDLSNVLKVKKKKNVGIQSIRYKDNVFFVSFGSQKDENGVSNKIRLMIANTVEAAYAKEIELKNLSIRSKSSRLKRSYSSGILQSNHMLERIALFMGKEKNSKDGDVESKIWHRFRNVAENKRLAKLNLVEMCYLLRFLEPHNLARIQECSRAMWFVAGQDALWSRLSTYSKQNPRLPKTLEMKLPQQLDGRAYLRYELKEWKLYMKGKRDLRELARISKLRERLLYPWGY